MNAARTFDVVIAGSGVAGLSAALAARRLGLSAIVIEKSALIGGASCWSYGAIWAAATRQAEAAGIGDDLAAAEAYLGFLGSGEADASRTRAVVRDAPRVLAALDDLGIGFTLIGGVGDLLAGEAPGAVSEGRTLEPAALSGAALGPWRDRLRTPPGGDTRWRVPRSTVARLTDPAEIDRVGAEAAAGDQLAQGPALVGALLLAAARAGAVIETELAADRLIVEHGRVAGVETRGGAIRAARGVLLATGNYASDHALVAALDKLPDYRSQFPETSTGDGLVLAASAGGAIRATRNNVVVMLGFDDPSHRDGLEAGAPSTRELPRAHSIVVNAAGRRFGNEASFQQLSRTIRALDWASRTPLNLPCWAIMDTDYVARWGIAGSPPGSAPDFVIRADSIAELAARGGIDADGLADTVARVNRFAANGVDEDFDRKPGWAMTPGAGSGPNPNLGAIARAPFYAAKLAPTMGVVGSGVKADADARVLDWRGAPIAGLYCAGDAALHDEFGAGYQAGVTFSSAMTFAWRAAEHMAAATAARVEAA